MLGRSIIVPQHVDSERPVVLGKITPDGKRWGPLLEKVTRFRQGWDGELPIVTKMQFEAAG